MITPRSLSQTSTTNGSSVDLIEVEQAVFASSDRGSVKGYQLISKSAGIDRSTSHDLCRWSPSRFAGANPGDWTINAFPVKDDQVAITRTLLGGAEYSGRGAEQVVTLILVLRYEQIVSYGLNAIDFANTALALGYLRLPPEIQHGEMDRVQLPNFPIVESANANPTPGLHGDLVDQVSQHLADSRRVAIVGLTDPISAAGQIVHRSKTHRNQFISFTTGLDPSIRRPFQLHFLTEADSTLRHTLESQEITVVDAID